MECQRGLATRKLSVHPSVSLSNAWIVTKRKNSSVQIFTPYERPLNLVFWKGEWLVGERPLLPEILG